MFYTLSKHYSAYPPTLMPNMPLSATKKTLGRPAVFQDGIYAKLRSRIVSGSLKPNDRFPTRRALCKEFDASTVTIQQVVDRLVSDNFLEARGARGTFVTEAPPHLTRYALVFPNDPESNRFWFALANEAIRLRHSKNVELVNYFNIDGHTDRKEYQELVDHVTHHRMAGIIFASQPYLLKDTPLVTEPGIPRAIIGRDDSLCPGIRVTGHGRDAIIRAAETIKSKGRNRVAVILSGYKTGMAQDISDELGIRGIHVPPWWIQYVPHHSPECARNLANLLTRNIDGIKPDTLIIANDNLVENATLGLLDSGVRIPEDLLVITHCNFPWPPRNHTPVIRIGNDCGEYLEVCMKAIDQQRQGVEIPPIYYVNKVLVEEAGASPASL